MRVVVIPQKIVNRQISTNLGDTLSKFQKSFYRIFDLMFQVQENTRKSRFRVNLINVLE